MQTIQIYRGSTAFETIKPSDNSVQQKKIMGVNQLALSFLLNHYAGFAIGDYAIVYGERYQINELPTLKKESSRLYDYTMTMDAEGFDLSKVQYFFLGDDNSLKESQFSLMGNADTFINLVLANLARVSSVGWIKGQVIPTEYKTLTFDKANCYNALGQIATAFDSEFAIEGRVIHLTKRSNDTGNTFHHGKSRGLYEIVRQNISNTSIVTRLYAQGSDKNLPPDYANFSTRLRMSGATSAMITNLYNTMTTGGSGNRVYNFAWTAPSVPDVTAVQIEYRPTGSTGPWSLASGSPTGPRSVSVIGGSYDFVFRTFYGTSQSVATPQVTIGGDIGPLFLSEHLLYVERNIDKYGIIEATQIFDDIYPHRTGSITSVDASNIYKFVDTSMDFDVNTQLLPGTAAKVTFNTGQLAGYTFEISNYHNATKEFTILRNKDEHSIEVPSTLFKPAIGDQYVLIDINMPQTYIDAAEAALKAKAEASLLVSSEPQVTYTLTFDPVYLRNKNLTLNIGDLIWLEDDNLGVQRKIRITSVTRNVLQEFVFQVELADIIQPSTIERIVNSTNTNSAAVNQVQGQVNNNALLNGIGIFPPSPGGAGFANLIVEKSTGKIFTQA
jgi:hypothetical protein